MPAAAVAAGAAADDRVAADEAHGVRINPFEAPAPGERADRGDVEPSQPDVVRLRAILAAGDASVVNLGGVVIALGEEAFGYRLTAVGERQATFEHGGQIVTLALDADEDG